MSDRELLELAAKAAGMELDYSIRPDGKAFYHSDRNAMALADGGWFAPLIDDGDALRLAIRLCLVVSPSGDYTAVNRFNGNEWTTEEYNRDPYAATRRAIVRAAAAIGKEMP